MEQTAQNLDFYHFGPQCFVLSPDVALPFTLLLRKRIYLQQHNFQTIMQKKGGKLSKTTTLLFTSFCIFFVTPIVNSLALARAVTALPFRLKLARASFAHLPHFFMYLRLSAWSLSVKSSIMALVGQERSSPSPRAGGLCTRQESSHKSTVSSSVNLGTILYLASWILCCWHGFVPAFSPRAAWCLLRYLDPRQ